MFVLWQTLELLILGPPRTDRSRRSTFRPRQHLRHLFPRPRRLCPHIPVSLMHAGGVMVRAKERDESPPLIWTLQNAANPCLAVACEPICPFGIGDGRWPSHQRGKRLARLGCIDGFVNYSA